MVLTWVLSKDYQAVSLELDYAYSLTLRALFPSFLSSMYKPSIQHRLKSSTSQKHCWVKKLALLSGEHASGVLPVGITTEFRSPVLQNVEDHSSQ